jgi:hypothetical protein
MGELFGPVHPGPSNGWTRPRFMDGLDCSLVRR